MPKAFEACVKNGGRIRTKKLSDGKYIQYAGEVKKKQKKNGDNQ